MAKVEVYRCDECGAEKKETNHWFVISNAVGLFRIQTWNPDAVSGHICGEQCVHKVLQKWLEGVK
jgi:hypothetical protein